MGSMELPEFLEQDWQASVGTVASQWEALLTAISLPNLGVASGALMGLARALGSLAAVFYEHPQLGFALLTGGTAIAGLAILAGSIGLLVALTGPIVAVGIAITGLVLALGALIYVNWGDITSSVWRGMMAITETIKSTLKYVFQQMALDLVHFIRDLPAAIYRGIMGPAPRTNDPAGERAKMWEFFFGKGDGRTWVPDEFGGGSFQKQNWVPPRAGGQMIQTHVAINLDNVRLADAVAYSIARRAEESYGAAPFDGSMHPMPVEHLAI
jgi:hypothetical protein